MTSLASFASTGRLHTLYSFCAQSGCADGWSPLGGLVEDGAGNLYGTTIAGGSNYAGVVYELVRAGDHKYNYQVLYNFCAANPCADYPAGNLVIDRAGNLYGVLTAGGAHYGGEAYELVRSGEQWTFVDLFDFGEPLSDGFTPVAGFTYAGAADGEPYDGQSPLFGMTSGGGNRTGAGVVYSLRPGSSGWTIAPIYEFCSRANCADGSNPDAPLFEDASGNLFGTTTGGGVGGGVVFELGSSRPGPSETVLYNFCSVFPYDCRDGAGPQGGVTMDSSGRLYGVTPFGGKSCDIYGENGCGVAYKLVPRGAGYTEVILHTFCSLANCADGVLPSSAPVLGRDGQIFGTTTNGGDLAINPTGGGTLFELRDSEPGYLRTDRDFCRRTNCTDGDGPANGFMRDRNGGLFGTTTDGGANAGGSVYEFMPDPPLSR